MKHKKAVEHYLKTGNRFILLRRWREDISNLWIEQYFSDVDVAKLTNNKYNCITCYRKVLYLGIYDAENNKTIKGEKIRLCNVIINRTTHVECVFSRC